MIDCDLCNKSFDTWHQLGEHIAHTHLPFKDEFGHVRVKCWCSNWFTMVRDRPGEHSNFSWHLYSSGGITSHVLENTLGKP